MKQISKYQNLFSLTILIGVVLFSPFLMAFSLHPLGQIPLPSPWMFRGLIKIGEWVITNLPFLVDVGRWLMSFITPDCPPGIIIPDPNSPLNGVYSSCYECTINEFHRKINHPFMVRPSVNAPWDLAPSFRNFCQ
jgi:hypothetical protein